MNNTDICDPVTCTLPHCEQNPNCVDNRAPVPPAPASYEALIAEGLRFPEGATRCADIQLQIMADAVLIYRLATALQSAVRERDDALEDFVRTSDLADEFCDEAATWKARAEAAEPALRLAQQRAEGVEAALLLAHETMVGVDVFVTSKQQIKRPDGVDWWEDRVRTVGRAALSPKPEEGL